MDVVEDYARPLPFTVITDVLGVPTGDRDGLGAAMDVLIRGFARQRDTDRSAVQAANDAAAQMLSYFAELLDQRAAAPADDLMTILAARHAGGEDRQDLLANAFSSSSPGTRPPPPCSPSELTCSAPTPGRSMPCARTPAAGPRPSRKCCA